MTGERTKMPSMPHSAACAASSSSPPISTKRRAFTKTCGDLRRVETAQRRASISAAAAVSPCARPAFAARSPRWCASCSRSPTAPAVEALHKAVDGGGRQARPRPADAHFAGGGYGFGCKDPDGRNLVFVCDCADHADTRRPAGPAAQDRACQSQHPRLRRDARVLHQALGFRVIDDNAPLWFLHCANADHCSIVLCQDRTCRRSITSPSTCRTFDSVMRGMGRMKDNGYPIEWGPGRHGPGD